MSFSLKQYAVCKHSGPCRCNHTPRISYFLAIRCGDPVDDLETIVRKHHYGTLGTLHVLSKHWRHIHDHSLSTRVIDYLLYNSLAIHDMSCFIYRHCTVIQVVISQKRPSHRILLHIPEACLIFCQSLFNRGVFLRSKIQ